MEIGKNFQRVTFSMDFCRLLWVSAYLFYTREDRTLPIYVHVWLRLISKGTMLPPHPHDERAIIITDDTDNILEFPVFMNMVPADAAKEVTA
jgi:hypothetical protein